MLKYIAAMSIENRSLPYLALGVGIVALGFSAIFVRWADVPGPVFGAYRIGLAALILSPAFFWNRRGKLKIPWAVLIFPLIGGIMTGFDHATWNTSVRFTTAANATLLGNTAPLWVALVAWLVFRERLVGLFWVGLVFVMGGGAIILGNDFFIHPTLGIGDLLAMASGMFYAGYFLATQGGRKHLDTLTYIWLVNLVACLMLVTMSLSLKLPLTGYPPKTYLAFLAAAVVSQIFGYVSITYALGHLPASMVAPTMIGQPAVTAIISIPLLGELLQPAQWLGGVVVLLGIYLVHRSREISARDLTP